MLLSCPLCDSIKTSLFHKDSKRPYNQCSQCELIFVPKQFHLNSRDEKAIYDEHQNSPLDQGYRTFLNRLVEPLRQALRHFNFPLNAKGLDFGSGPGPTLSVILEEQGYDMAIYDIFYANRPEVLKQRYDFITSTEVWEHLSEPNNVIQTLFDLGKEKHILGIMTKRIPQTDFPNWHYIKDPTHVTFFTENTLKYIAKKYDYELLLPANDTAIFIKA